MCGVRWDTKHFSVHFLGASQQPSYVVRPNIPFPVGSKLSSRERSDCPRLQSGRGPASRSGCLHLYCFLQYEPDFRCEEPPHCKCERGKSWGEGTREHQQGSSMMLYLICCWFSALAALWSHMEGLRISVTWGPCPNGVV